jgi:hypothetical protein
MDQTNKYQQLNYNEFTGVVLSIIARNLPVDGFEQ